MAENELRERAGKIVGRRLRKLRQSHLGHEQTADLIADFASLIRKEAMEHCAKIVETCPVLHGDHYASYSAPSTDAEKLATAIREQMDKEGLR